MDLPLVKNYLKVDIDDDDAFISNLIVASDQYLKGAGALDTVNPELYVIAQQMLISHWYDNRQPTLPGNISGVSRALQFALESILFQLRYVPAPVITV